jgi:hypothetical protein
MPKDVFSFALDRIKMLGAIVTAIVGIGSTLFACSADNIKRNEAFQSAVAGQEKQWQGLYDQYFAALASGGTEDIRDKRLLALCRFSNRAIPGFQEHELGLIWLLDSGRRQDEARHQLSNLKDGLRTALITEGIATDSSRDCVLAQKREEEADTATTRDRVDAPPAQAAADASATASGQASPTIVASVTKDAQIKTVQAVEQSRAILQAPNMKADRKLSSSVTLAAGNPKGYDVDIFFCTGPNEDGRRAETTQVAGLLSSFASQQQPIGAGYRIGRVRLRPLTAEKQLDPGYPSSGWQVRGEASEAGMRNALVQLFNQQGRAQYIGYQSKQATPWYLSAFICS